MLLSKSGRKLSFTGLVAVCLCACGPSQRVQEECPRAEGDKLAMIQLASAGRVSFEQATTWMITEACDEAYKDDGKQAQHRCLKKYSDLVTNNDNEGDEEEEAAGVICREQGMLEEKLEDCKDAAVTFLLAEKRGLSLGDVLTVTHFESACSYKRLCLEKRN